MFKGDSREGERVFGKAAETRKGGKQHKAVLPARNADRDMVAVLYHIKFLASLTDIAEYFLHKIKPSTSWRYQRR